MPVMLILVACIVLLFLAYRYYSPVVASKLGVEPDRPTPARTRCGGIDYYPARLPVLFGHHFASIAGAAPIIGPVAAAAYGWGPVILWILLGGIFLGAVHDFSAVIVSIRHDGKSIGEVMDRQIGRAGKLLFLCFLWATLVLIIAVFLVVVTETFVTMPVAGSASLFLVLFAILFGAATHVFRLPFLWTTLAGIVILALCMAIGWRFPIALNHRTWLFILIGYIFAASVTPVWLLLQPRDYLNSFLLYALLGFGIAGIFASRPAVEFPFFIGWDAPALGPLFPILFVTMACGAISGFHSIVGSGTTAKQLARERDARPIGYGAMMVECLLAVIALITVIGMTRAGYTGSLAEGGPVALFSRGIGTMLSAIGVNPELGMEFAALAVSAFVLTTLDTATRLSRMTWQELFVSRGTDGEHARGGILGNGWTGTLVTIGAAAALACSGTWKTIWPIFGSANQLLAALALLAVVSWCIRSGRSARFVAIPMAIMFIISLSALGLMFYRHIISADYALAAIAVSLFVLAVVMLVGSAGKIRT